MNDLTTLPRPCREDVERVLGFSVVQWPGAYVTACTHPSALKFDPTLTASYERLEYLGDAVIGFVIGSWLFSNFPAADEGMLSQMRTRLVSGDCLSRLARRLGLGNIVIMAPRNAKYRWSTKVLEDVFEALVGAVFVDCGMAAAKTFVLNAVCSTVSLHDLLVSKNYKDQLMQLCHRMKHPLPTYDVVSDPGVKGFMVRATACGACGTGSGDTKKAAEQQAALAVLYHLGYHRSTP